MHPFLPSNDSRCFRKTSVKKIDCIGEYVPREMKIEFRRTIFAVYSSSRAMMIPDRKETAQVPLNGSTIPRTFSKAHYQSKMDHFFL